MTDPPALRVAPPEIVRQGAVAPVLAAVLAALPAARVVGGAVRDTLAGRAVQDVDVAVPLPPERVASALLAAGLGVHETGVSHGTLTATLRGQPVEVTSLRRDVLTDGRHATVAWTDDWRDDAARRDFTFNAMSMAADGRVWDYFGGRDDLAAGRVRFVGAPATRLAEDYLRALRYFRFLARYGRGAPDAAAVSAVADAVPGLARLSPERVWMELKRLLVPPDRHPEAGAALAEALRVMAATGVLGAVLPEGACPTRLARLLPHGLPAEALLRLAVLMPLGVDAAALAARLRWSREELEVFRTLRVLDGAPTPATVHGYRFRSWRVAVRDRSPLVPSDWPLWVAQAEWGGDGWDEVRGRLAPCPDDADPVFPLHGRDVLALGIPPGPEIGRILSAVRAYWVARDCAVSESILREELAREAGRRPLPSRPVV